MALYEISDEAKAKLIMADTAIQHIARGTSALVRVFADNKLTLEEAIEESTKLAAGFVGKSDD